MRATRVTVNGTTPTLLVDADNKNRNIYLHVVGNQAVALGGSTVTFATGLLTEKHTSPVEIFLPLGETIYGICAAGTTESICVMTPDLD